MNKRRLLLLVLVVATVFSAGLDAPVQAFHAPNHGYFKGGSESGTWDNIWPASGGRSGCRGNGNALPTWVNTADEFINFTFCKLGGNTQERIGAAFIISTMTGDKDITPNAAQRADFAARVKHAESRGWINFRASIACNPSSPPRNTFYQSTRQDAAWYWGCPISGSGGIATSAVTFYNGSSTYILMRYCANPVGSMPPLAEGPDFNMTGHSTIQNSTTGSTVNGNMSVAPGDRLRFRHYVRNQGPTSTSPTSINWAARNTISGSRTGDGNAGTFSDNQQKNVYNESYFTIPLGTAAGTQHCRRVEWSPDTENGGSGRGPTRCATVAAAHDLHPAVTVSDATAQEGDSVTFTFTIDNQGTNNNPPVNCTANGSQPAGVPGPPTIPPGCPPGTFPWNAPNPTVVTTQSIDITGQPPGSRVCRSLTVNPATASGGARTSPEACVTVVKTPYVRFMGNDVWAGGGFVDPCNTPGGIETVGRQLSAPGNPMAGSVGEYHAFALGRVESFGSSSRVLVGLGSVGLAARQLTFSNNGPEAGHFNQPRCMPDYSGYASIPPQAGPGAVNVGSRSSGQWHYVPPSGNLNLNGAMQPGAKQVYYVEGDVTVTGGGITYPGTYGSAADIPSLLVVATGDIRVHQQVSQLDGIFVAVGDGEDDGVFYTCWPVVTPPSVNNPCDDNQLRVHGAVIAGRIDLYRSFGAEGPTPTARQEPGENFQFSPELYLNNVINSTNQTTIETTNILELPPRF